MFSIKELKKLRRGGQWERHKTIGLISENNFSAHTCYILVHIFAVPCKKKRQVLWKSSEHTMVNFPFSFWT